MLQQPEDRGGVVPAEEAVAASAGYRLSSAQLGIWIDCEIDPTSANYNVSEYLEIPGVVNADAFERALRQVVAEVDALNVRFVVGQDGPRQIRDSHTAWRMPVLDMCGAADPDAAARAWMQADVEQIVDPRSAPLFAYALFKVADNRWLWFRRYHHLVMDGAGATLSV